MSEEMRNRGRSRKRKRSSRQSRRAVQPNSSYYILSSQEGDPSLPGTSTATSISYHTDLEQQLRADSLFLLRSDVLILDDEDSRRSKRSRPVGSSMPTNGRRSPQPGTSRDLYAPSELQQRAWSPSSPDIPIATISDSEDTALPSMTRADTPIFITDISDDQDELPDIFFVGMLGTPYIEMEFNLVDEVVTLWEIHNHLPLNVPYDLPTMIFNPENANEQSDCRICLSNYVEGEELTILPCSHNFHSNCVNQWLLQSPTCPMCRTQMN
ncbi:RING-H2 finger protein ATL81-like [Alosa sapidissima]|uniref:RING-H2 finger protein ATL81-like n=1 Tax=Alosa sapidissima TaxID=34773 RepID=UPI001C087E6F|nr:RING-H2 finger protein ATL81-like [Alosa sapidissima]XP_041926909.1 RING-H2 finger protein ATL81-like [Alosa sapidissima]